MRRFIQTILLLWLCIFFIHTKAQSFQEGEYFFDQDPGIGNAISLSVSSLSDSLDLNASISTLGLSLGSHQLFVRFKDTADNWSLANGQSLIIIDNNNSTTVQLVSGEYFFDTDPGVGYGISVISFSTSDSLDLDLNLSTLNLAVGPHQLFYRFIDSGGNWSQVVGKTFSISDPTNIQSSTIISGEYFIDTDPGVGNAIAISFASPSDSLSIDFNIPTSGLSLGVHQLFYRFLDSQGSWSQIEGRSFSVSDTANSQSPTVVSGEYFFDLDPGVGNGIAILSANPADSLTIDFNISASGLSLGAHQLFYRFLDSQGSWSQIEGRSFSISDTANSQSPTVVSGEYFFDLDPGVGNGIAVSSTNPADSLIINFDISSSGLSLGAHQLFYRFVDSQGSWSQVAAKTFAILDTSNSQTPSIVGGEYFFDIDLGVGNGTPIPSFIATDTLDLSHIITSTNLSFGAHHLFYRFYDSEGNWGQINEDSVMIVPCFVPTANFVVSDICFGDSIVFIDSSIQTDNNSSYVWDIYSNQAIIDTTNGSLTYAPLPVGFYSTMLKIDNGVGCMDSIIKTFNVFSLPSINLGPDTSICHGDSILLSVGSFTSYLWNDGLVGVNRFVSTANTYWLEVTDSNQCSFRDSLLLSEFPLPIVQLSGVASSYCSNDQSSVFVGVPQGGTFIGNGLIDSVFYPNVVGGSNLQFIYQYSDSNNCANSDTVQTVVYDSPVVDYSGLASNYCSNDAPEYLVPNITGGVFQGLGINGSVFTPSNALIGQSIVKYSLTDIHGCKDSISHISTIFQAPVISSFTASPISFTTTPFVSQFSPNVSNPSDYSWTWDFGDGVSATDSTPTHQYYDNGSYSVSLAAQDINTGCSDTVVKANLISCSGAVICNLGAKIWFDTLSLATICPEDSFLLNSGLYNSSYTYMWLRNGVLIPNTNSNNFYAKQQGYYQVIIGNGSCMDISSIFYLSHHMVTTPIVQQFGVFRPCRNDSVKLNSLVSYPNYLWSTGDTTSEIYVKTSGYYSFSVIDAQGCMAASQDIIVNASVLPVPEICRLSVDTITGYNVLAWNNNMPLATDSFKVYRETYFNNQFDLIASMSAATNMSFIDYNSLPKSRSYRYRISMVDSCGIETPMSSYHKSVHFIINVGFGGKWNLYWNKYKGRSVSTYQIFRGLDSTQMQLLTQVPASIRSYTDYSAPSGNVYYQIKALFSDICIYSLAWSNMLNTSNASGVSINNSKQISGLINIYPNPNNGRFTISFIAVREGRSEIELFDAMGKRVYYKSIHLTNGINQNVDMQTLSKGMYFIRISQQGSVLAKKVIVIQ